MADRKLQDLDPAISVKLRRAQPDTRLSPKNSDELDQTLGCLRKTPTSSSEFYGDSRLSGWTTSVFTVSSERLSHLVTFLDNGGALRTIVTGIFILKWQHKRSVLVHQMKIIYPKPTCTSICVPDSNHLPTMIFSSSFFYYSTMVIFFFQNVFFQQRALFDKVIKNKFNQYFTTLLTLIPFIVQETKFLQYVFYNIIFCIFTDVWCPIQKNSNQCGLWDGGFFFTRGILTFMNTCYLTIPNYF